MSEKNQHIRLVLIFYTDGGGGHKAVSPALQQERVSEYQCEVDIGNVYREVIHELEPYQKLFNCSSERVFNKWVIKIRRLFQLVTKYPAALLMRANHNKLQRMITSHLTQRNPGVVI